MADEFATVLSDRILSHESFWDDLTVLQAASVRHSVLNNLNESLTTSNTSNDAERLSRLLFCASVFSQTSSEKNKGLAQTIALSALLSTTDTKIRERTTKILADIGNFPSVKYLEEKYSTNTPDFLSKLNISLLKALNSVSIGNIYLPLTDFQLDIWKGLPTSTSTSISAPTSAGKSFLLIEYLCQRAINDEKFIAVYITPTRALLAEVHRKISDRLTGFPEIRVSTVPSLDSEDRLKQVFVLTQERLHVLLSIADIRANIVIVDEAQNLSDGTRGMILYDCLERLRKNNEAAQIFLLSPGAEGFTEVARLLGLGAIDIKETYLSPVLQNRILVKAVDGNPKELILSLLSQTGIAEIGRFQTERGVADPATRLAIAALELGGQGAALVYATGPVDAERVASQLTAGIQAKPSPALKDLSKFIKDHIHPEYGLAAMILHGVSFHYGRMPTLLREAIESAFSDGKIRYLVCTTTLFQGVNLPARSVFINTPTRGKGIRLDTAHLWNFAGRAGRLGQDLVGNVFLVDYHQWKDQELDQPAKFKVKAALPETVVNHFDSVLSAISGDMPKLNPRDSAPSDIRAAAGFLLAKATNDQSPALIGRLNTLSVSQRSQLDSAAKEYANALRLSVSVLENNWNVDPYGLQRLADRMRVKIKDGKIEDLIPIHPRENGAYQRYASIFSRLVREVLAYKVRTYGGFVATYAMPWMSGMPYPVLLGKWIDYHRKKKPDAKINDLVRTGFDFIEDVLRFQMVQLGKAYIDVLHDVLIESGMDDRCTEIFDYSLALELGVSSTSGRAFIELGTSRITALALEALFPDSELTPAKARKQLAELNVDAASLSPIIVSELRQLRLIPAN